MYKPIIILMTRWHGIKRCKTRLAKDIGFIQAVAIQKKLTKHTISVARSLEKKGLVEVQLAISGIGPNSAKRFCQNEGLSKVTVQKRGCLGLRIRHEILNSQKKIRPRKYRKRSAIVIGTDLPSLCEFDLIEALIALKNNEIVIGPSDDGGYWLIGLSGSLVNPLISWPFAGIPWGTKDVTTKTIEKAQVKNIPLKFLKHKNDVDRLGDLSPWLI
tara:strand:- start:5439 stop:6083 length:645 start_codon:yes stop_codon:yes gene_type:complete